MSRPAQGSLSGQVALITGASGGIGQATAEEMAAHGADIVLADLSAPAALAQHLATTYGVSAISVAMDVTSAASVLAARDQAVAALGKITILVNNAGIMQRVSADHHTLPQSDFDRMLSVHVSGPAIVAAACIPDMREHGFGRIINLSSVIGHVGLARRTAYSTAKAAIAGLTRGLAMENARSGITVNSVSPGYVLTAVLREKVRLGTIDYAMFAGRSAVGRWAEAQEIARVIRFLAEPASGFVTGADWAVDGGYSINGNPGEDVGPIVPFSATGPQV
ncbi:SDR family NAD(P)-dependent oxidoreductase [Devosia sp. A449]